jgi:chromosome segregation ATPase
VWTTDTQIEIDHIDGEVEFGERFAMEIAHELGWISPKAWRSMQDQMETLAKEAESATADKLAAEEAVDVVTRQAGTALADKDAAEERIKALTSQTASLKGTISALKRQIVKMGAEAEAEDNFGD